MVRHTALARAAAAAALTGLAFGLLPAAPARADTVRQMQWHLRALDLDRVHRITKGAGVVVAVLDTGVETTHPDLRGQVLKGIGFGKGAGPLAGGVDVDGHGTGMAGTIAAKGGGEMHALGVAPAAKILPVRITDRGYSDSDAINDGIRWAADHGAKIINISFTQSSAALDSTRQAVAYALGKDAVVVAGAGNRPEGHTIVGMPANIPGVVAVGATGKSGGLWSGSITGPELALTAPGVEIVTAGSRRAGIDTGYASGTGTSSATAIVSGAAALIRARYPRLKAPDVINRLVATAEDAGTSGRDEQYGYGRLDIMRALTAQVPPVRVNPLGQPQGTAPAAPGALADDADEARPNPLTGEAIGGLILMGTVLLAVPIGLIVLLVLSRRRRRRRLATQGPPLGWPTPVPGGQQRPPGAPWPGPSTGHGPPPAGPYGAGPPGTYPPPQHGGYPPPPPGSYPPPQHGGYPPPRHGGYPPPPPGSYPPAQHGGYPPPQHGGYPPSS